MFSSVFISNSFLFTINMYNFLNNLFKPDILCWLLRLKQFSNQLLVFASVHSVKFLAFTDSLKKTVRCCFLSLRKEAHHPDATLEECWCSERNCLERHGKCKRLRLDLHTVTKATSWNSGPIPRSTESLLNTARHWAFQSDLERKVTHNKKKKRKKSKQKHSIMLCVCRTRSKHQKLQRPC